MTNQTAMPELLICPFCGSSNVKAFSYDEYIGGEPDAFCQCQDCAATGPSRKDEGEAIAAWNKRAISQQGEPDAVVVTFAQGRNSGKQVYMLRELPNGTKLYATSPQAEAAQARQAKPRKCSHEWWHREAGEPWLVCEKCGVEYGDHDTPAQQVEAAQQEAQHQVQPSARRLVSIIAAMNGWDMPGGLPEDVTAAAAQPSHVSDDHYDALGDCPHDTCDTANCACIAAQQVEAAQAPGKQDLDAIGDALSKLESQIVRNPTVPAAYSTILREAFAALARLREAAPVQPAQQQGQSHPCASIDADSLLIDICYIEGTDPFIYGINGKINIGALQELEEAIIEYQKDEDEDTRPCKETGDYVFKAYYEKPQIGDYGRIEFEGYWDLTLVSFEPDPDAARAAQEKA